MLRVRTRAKYCLTAMSTVISTKGQSGLLEWLRSCPDHDWFVEIESGSTVGLGYGAWQEPAYLFRSSANARRLLDADG